jgi:hypothetical protein
MDYTYGAGAVPPKVAQGSGAVWRWVTDPKKYDYWEGAAFSVYAADLDGYGDLDILSASLNDRIVWYENADGRGTFGDQQVITTQAGVPFSVNAADLDGDGEFDSSDMVMAFQAGVYQQQPPVVQTSVFDDALGQIASRKTLDPISPSLLDAVFALEDSVKKSVAFVA